MKKLLIVFLLVGVVGCSNGIDSDGRNVEYGIQVVKMGGCEYVLYVSRSNGSPALVHAGNCHNPEHSRPNQ